MGLETVRRSLAAVVGAGGRELSHADDATVRAAAIVRRTETRALADIDPSMRWSDPTGPR
jgi:hypothetical protein